MNLYCPVCARHGSPRVEARYLVAGYSVCFNHITAATPRYYLTTSKSDLSVDEWLKTDDAVPARHLTEEPA